MAGGQARSESSSSARSSLGTATCTGSGGGGSVLARLAPACCCACMCPVWIRAVVEARDVRSAAGAPCTLECAVARHRESESGTAAVVCRRG